MRSIFYTLSALVLLVVVSMFVNIQHQWAKTQETAMLDLYENEKMARAYSNIMGQLLPVLATRIQANHTSAFVDMSVAFVSTVNNTDPDDQHFFHLLNNLHRYREFVTMYGIDELGLKSVDLDTLPLESYMTNSSRSFAYTVEPYGFGYEWSFTPGLRDQQLSISRPGGAGDWVRVSLSGGVPASATSSCCTAQNLTFGDKGNVSVRWAPSIILDFSLLDPTKIGIMEVNTSLRLPATPSRVVVKARGVSLNMTQRNIALYGNTVFTG